MAHLAREFSGFRPAAQTFLRRLARHNRREWFEANRDAAIASSPG
jgi:uncharacterized protein (DUF2461 family)